MHEITKPHGNTGRRNAAKDDARRAVVSARVQDRIREALEREAEQTGVPLNRLASDILTAHVERSQ